MDIYESALNKINRDRKCIPNCCFGPTGPTGPTGPQGLPSSKVTVLNTVTSDPGGEAMVYNSGDENNVLLNFVIPRGERGPVAQFSVGSVVTSLPGTDAQVTITPIYK